MNNLSINVEHRVDFFITNKEFAQEFLGAKSLFSSGQTTIELYGTLETAYILEICSSVHSVSSFVGKPNIAFLRQIYENTDDKSKKEVVKYIKNTNPIANTEEDMIWIMSIVLGSHE